MERADSRRNQVRANLSSTLSAFTSTSCVVLAISLLFRLAKLTLTEYYLIVYSDQLCDKPLATWITGNVVLDFIYLGLLTAMLAKVIQNDGSSLSCSESISNFLSKSYFIWMILGNFWYYTSHNCEEMAPDLVQIAFWLLVLGYLYYTFPCWCCCLLILCIPVIFAMAKKWSHYLQSAKAEEQVNQLIERPLESHEDHDCPICCSDFAQNETVFQMPCDHRHFFHHDCIVSWLRVNPTCPICRHPESD